MADIELVIKIDEGIAKGIIDGENDTPRHIVQGFQSTIANAIKNGTPLPKGHGRLIDADKLHHCECKGNFSECDTCLDDYLCNLVNDAPTIIEAESEEKQ